MLNKFTLLLSFIIIFFVHMTVLTLYKSEEKKLVVSQKTNVTTIALRKVVLKKKEIKKVEHKKEFKKVVLPKKVEKRVNKIIKKAKRKIPKKVEKVKKVKKLVKKEPVKIEKKVEKVVEKTTPKITPTVVKKIAPVITKKMIISDVNKNVIKNEYLIKLRNTIENNKIYPKRAKRLKQQGKVIVSFEITKNGDIKKVVLKNACPYKRLNSAAIDLLMKIAKFEPIPKELEKNTWAIEIPINYSIVNI